MTVNTTNITSGPYSGNGVTTEFSYTFRVENKNQLLVYEKDANNIVTTKVVDTEYTVAGLGLDGGGTITFGTAPVSGTQIYIRSNYQNTQLTDFDSQGGFFPEVHEDAFDKLTYQIQQLQDQVGRAVRISTSDFDTSLNPLPSLVANSFIRVKNTEDGFDMYTIGGNPSANEISLNSYDDFRNGVGFTIGDYSDGQVIWFTGNDNTGPGVLVTGAGAVDDSEFIIRSNVDTGRYWRRFGKYVVTDYSRLATNLSYGVYDVGDVVTVRNPSGPSFIVQQGVQTDDAGVIITENRGTTSASELYAERIYEGYIDLRWYAAADGVTNDKTIIDSFNTANTTINLGGATYAYTGNFNQVATFINGTIVSSTFGTFSYTNDNLISQDTTITVGAAGTFKRLDAALDYLKTQRITALVTLSILDKFSTKAASDPMALDNYLFDHPDSHRVELVGPTMTGAVPRNSDMTGTEATDETFALGRYNASIYLPGLGLSGSYGLACPYGLKRVKDIMFVSDNRYSVDIGFTGSHFSSSNGRGCIFENFTIFGGVWGVIGKKAHLAFNSDSFFAYQIGGGPIDSIGCVVRADVATMNCYTISGVQPADGPAYAIFAEEKSTIYLPFNNVELFEAKGSFLHGIYARDYSWVYGVDMTFTGVTQPMTAANGSNIEANNPIISDADPANTALVSGASQGGYGNNIYQGALFCAGLNSSINIQNGTVDNCIASYCGIAAGGKLINGYTDLAIDDCRWTVNTFVYDLSDTSLLSVTITNPKASSIDQAVAQNQSQVRVSTNSGISFSPALNTTTNGNLFSSAS